MQHNITPSLQNRALEQTRVFVSQLSQHCTHELTLHTRLRVSAKSTHSRQQHVYRAQAVMRYFQPRFLRAVAGNTWQRYAHRVPVFIPALEGINTDQDRVTLHWHVMLGNLPQSLTTQTLLAQARMIWIEHDDAGTDIEAQQLYYSPGFGNYITKQLHTHNPDCIDHTFLQAPAHIINRLSCCP